MTIPFRGTVNIDIKDSVPDWEPYRQPIAPEGAPSVLYIVLDDVGFSALGVVRRVDRDAEHQSNRRSRSAVHRFPHDGAVLADPFVSAHWPQSHDQRDGLHQRGVVGVPQRQRSHPVRVRHHRRGAGRPGLEHVHGRQVAPLCRRRDEHGVDQDVSGRSAVDSSGSTGSSVPRPTSGIPTSCTTTTRSSSRASPEDGYHFTTDITDKALEFIRDAKAVAPDKPFFMYFAPGAAHAPHHAPKEWIDQVRREVRHGLRGVPGDRVRPPEGDGDRSRGRPS